MRVKLSSLTLGKARSAERVDKKLNRSPLTAHRSPLTAHRYPSPSNVSNRYCHTSVCRKGHSFDDYAEEKAIFC